MHHKVLLIIRQTVKLKNFSTLQQGVRSVSLVHLIKHKTHSTYAKQHFIFV